jgi:hypothetical protein
MSSVVVAVVAATVGYQFGRQQALPPVDRLMQAVAEPAVRRDSPRLDLPAQCHQTAKLWQSRLDENCRAVVKPPFVLAGNLSSAELTQLYDQTISPAANALASDYFAIPPDQPITLLCFADAESYTHAATTLLGERNPSPYGFYRPHGRVVIANLATGTGTMIHELTHALVDFDFPKLADWFNEGLASLHEACRYQTHASGDLHLQGLTNWRLPGLQKLIANRTLRPTRTMIAADDFRGPLEGANYAQARYLCLYLQQQGKLAEFYRVYRSNQTDDPLGEASLAQVLEIADWGEFDRDFWRWVMSLNHDL